MGEHSESQSIVKSPPKCRSSRLTHQMKFLDNWCDQMELLDNWFDQVKLPPEEIEAVVERLTPKVSTHKPKRSISKQKSAHYTRTHVDGFVFVPTDGQFAVTHCTRSLTVL